MLGVKKTGLVEYAKFAVALGAIGMTGMATSGLTQVALCAIEAWIFNKYLISNSSHKGFVDGWGTLNVVDGIVDVGIGGA